ncbi:MAG: NAD(P)/FAD-dependent oxidoreductase [Gammaproteobacteria bacterium]|nr:NAD(P)/FAD-dependent oxidoreductase [Gammaproteobacteria bacterium]
MTSQYDIVIIGAGHNGLVAAAYLARAGKKVLLLERRAVPGGQLVSETVAKDFTIDAIHAGARLRPDIARELGLSLPAAEPGVFTSLLPDGARLQLDTLATSADSIRVLSQRDAARWPEFVAFMNKAAGFLDAAYRTPMPRLPGVKPRSEGVPLAMLGLRLRRLGARDMFRVIRALPMTALELVDEWFESPELKAAIASLGIHGLTLGPMSAGTGYTLMHNWLNRGGIAHRQIAGGVGTLSRALVELITARGGEIRTGCAVSRVRIANTRATGVVLASGEEIAAGAVFSDADPRHTLLELVGAAELPPEFVWQVQSIKMRGSVAKVHLLTDGSHGLPAGTLVHAPSIVHLERACDAAKYGEISTAPYLEITTSGMVVSVHFQAAPYALRNSDWQSSRASVEELAIDTLAGHFPALKSSIRARHTITPLDLEQRWGLTEGDLNHGQLLLDQFFFLRPLPGWSDHRTPIESLYLCGSGVHGGGGISGASGRNAARLLLRK